MSHAFVSNSYSYFPFVWFCFRLRLRPTAGSRAGSNEAQTTPVQPERTPQQSEQVREQDRKSAEDTRIKRDWTAQQRDDDRMDMDRMRQRHMGREDMDHRTTGGNWRMQRDDDDMGRHLRYRDEDRPRRRIKICFEYENGDEFCRYRD
ncbi:hypothetical protein [Bradyrhizobium sp. SBR1B]|uniref:hypothetical protein n=1 Tax=Bradyrhizobium sp. SBR1B TaxID=2663836 RepID=UPI0016056376|nr:hypothetical protein [Bradyrhizobium sp. SBR1B]MBB4382941.1 hypothetical protein [Bradyrhizobium sp. SBR1B]